MQENISSFREEVTELGKVKLEPPQEIYLDYGPNLPEQYDCDRITALVRDPLCVFAYWELSGPRIRSVIKTIGESTLKQSRWILRLYNRSHKSQSDVNIPTPSRWDCIKNSWYFTELQADTKYQVEIGMITPAGAFIALAQSNTVMTPRLGFAIDQVQPEIYFYLR